MASATDDSELPSLSSPVLPIGNRRISSSTGITCNSRHLRWKVTSCQSNTASKFNYTTFHRSGGSRNLSTPPPLPYHPGKSGGGGYQPLVPPATPPPGMWSQPPPPKTLTQPYNWHPANWADERHPKIAAMMEPLLTKYPGRCLMSNILTASRVITRIFHL